MFILLIYVRYIHISFHIILFSITLHLEKFKISYFCVIIFMCLLYRNPLVFQVKFPDDAYCIAIRKLGSTLKKIPHTFYLKLCLSVERNHPSFLNISPTVGSEWFVNGKVFTSTTAWKVGNPKIWISQENDYLSVSAVMFCKQFLAYSYCAHSWVCFLMLSINIHVGLNIYLC